MPSTYLCCGKVGDNLVNYFSKDSVLLEKKKNRAWKQQERDLAS